MKSNIVALRHTCRKAIFGLKLISFFGDLMFDKKKQASKRCAPIKINIGGIINSYCKTAKRPIYFIDSTISAYLKSLFFNMALAPSFKEIKRED